MLVTIILGLVLLMAVIDKCRMPKISKGESDYYAGRYRPRPDC